MEYVIPAKRSASRNPCDVATPHWILAYARMTAEKLQLISWEIAPWLHNAHGFQSERE
jgi:hypothetical protein